MKKVRIFAILAIAVALASLSACNNSEEGPGPEIEVTINGLSDSKWTYFSFETGEVVGTSDFLNEEQDATWAARTDWDVAFCGDYIRTNSGTSGNGHGGVQRDSTHNYVQITTAPESGYWTDSDGIVKE